MKELETAVLNAATEMVKSGRLEAVCKKQIEESLTSIVKEVFSTYSPFGKNLKETIASQLKIDPSQLGLSEYNQTVLAIVQQKIDAVIDKTVRIKLAKDLDDLLGEAAPKEIKLSRLILDFKKWASKDGGGDGSGCTIILDPPEYSSYYLAIDSKPRVTKYNCRFRLMIALSDGKVFGIHIDGIDPSKSIFLGNMYGFPRQLFQMYAAGTRIVVDERSFDTGLRDRNDDEEGEVDDA